MILKVSALLLSSFWKRVSAQTLYSVIMNFPGTDAGVVVGDELYFMSPSGKSNIVWQAKAPGDQPYYYVKLRKDSSEIVDREPFERYPALQRWTFNEFYGRNWNAKEVLGFETVPGLSHNYNRAEDNDLHPRGEIATVHIVAAETDFKNIHDHFLDSVDINVNVTHISATSVKHFPNCKFGVSGRTSRYFNKLPYKVKIPKNGFDLNGFRNIKLRALSNDPSYLREYLTGDIIRAMNQPSTRVSFVRLFFNEQPIGLYALMEKYDDTWLEREFNRDRTQPYLNGILYEGHGGKTNDDRADLSFRGNSLAFYEAGPYKIAEKPKSGPESFESLIDLMSFIKAKNQMSISSRRLATDTVWDEPDWETMLDVDGFLANMAIEFFLGFSDGYTQNTNNFYLYFDPYYSRYVFIPWDFDYTFGSGPFDMDHLTTGNYAKYGRMIDLPLTAALFSVPQYKQRFEEILDLMATHIMAPEVAFPVIDSVAEFIREDVEWDTYLPRVRTGPSWVSGGLQSFIEGKIDEDSIFPYCTSIFSAIEFLIRVNNHISLDSAIDDRLNRASLLGLKEYFERKLKNYEQHRR
ncbi:coth protein-domain-containing protein [Sporodiniella umbellata]|nr:coth protein-domain-containing protein [Sporodiniella umbellata]